MEQTTVRREPGAVDRPTRIGWIVASVVSFAAVMGAAGWQVGQPPLAGRHQASPVTGFLAGGLEWTAAIAGVTVVGALLATAWGYRRPERGAPWKLGDREYALLATGRRWALVWGVSALLLVPVNAADTNGMPLSYVLGSLGDYLTSTQTTQAWLLVSVIAFAVALGCWLSTTWRWTVGMTVLGVLAALPTVVTAQVSVGAGHDLATDAAIFFTLAITFWFAAIWTARATTAAIGADQAASRIRRVGCLAAVVAVVTRIGIAIFELAGQSPLSSAYGLVLCALVLVLGVLALRAFVRRPAPGRALDRGLVVIVLGLQAALLRLVPPRYLVPQSPVENYLGYQVPAAPEVSLALLPGRPNLLLLVISLVMIGLYVWGVVRLRRSGDSWPFGRTIAWIAGWLLVIILIGSRMWAYSSATFSWHMVVHMTLNMGAPVLLVMGGPITLLLRTTSAHGSGRPVGLHDLANAMMNWRLVQVVLNPIIVWLLFVGSLYVLYFSPLFDVLMRYHWAHQLMAVHFLISGYLFYWLIIGVDRPPSSMPHIAKLGFVFAAMPFHAFFAVVVLSTDGALIGENFYTSLDLPWLTDLAAQQRAGGQVTWATGELPLFVMIIALVAQWFRQDQREARRRDRAADAGHDDSLDAYNEMLAALAARDRHESDSERQGRS